MPGCPELQAILPPIDAPWVLLRKPYRIGIQRVS